MITKEKLQEQLDLALKDIVGDTIQDKLSNLAKIRKSHTRQIYTMGSFIPSDDKSALKGAITSLKDAKAGLFSLSKVKSIECHESEDKSLNKEGWDNCKIRFDGVKDQFFEGVQNILTDEHVVAKLASDDNTFYVKFISPSDIQLFTWKGALVDFNPKMVKKAILDKRFPKDKRLKLARQVQFTKAFAKSKSVVKEDL